MNGLVWFAAGALAVVLVWLLTRHQAGATSREGARALDAVDTVTGWQPQVMRILTQHERLAWRALTQALPEYMVLAKVPLARFLRVPKRNSFEEWMERVGRLSADLLVCDRATEVIAVVEIRSPGNSERSKRRNKRMARVLHACNVRLVVWIEDAIPGPGAVREAVLPDEASQRRRPAPALPDPGLLLDDGVLPLPEIAELSHDQPLAARDPPASTWFDDFDSRPARLAREEQRKTGSE